MRLKSFSATAFLTALITNTWSASYELQYNNPNFTLIQQTAVRTNVCSVQTQANIDSAAALAPGTIKTITFLNNGAEVEVSINVPGINVNQALLRITNLPPMGANDSLFTTARNVILIIRNGVTLCSINSNIFNTPPPVAAFAGVLATHFQPAALAAADPLTFQTSNGTINIEAGGASLVNISSLSHMPLSQEAQVIAVESAGHFDHAKNMAAYAAPVFIWLGGLSTLTSGFISTIAASGYIDNKEANFVAACTTFTGIVSIGIGKALLKQSNVLYQAYKKEHLQIGGLERDIRIIPELGEFSPAQ